MLVTSFLLLLPSLLFFYFFFLFTCNTYDRVEGQQIKSKAKAFKITKDSYFEDINFIYTFRIINMEIVP